MPQRSSPDGFVRRSPKFRTFGSMAVLADELRKHATLKWHDQPRSLTNELSKLDRGEAGWWDKRPEHAAHLASLLGVEVDDLGLGMRAPAVHELDFPGFPGMPPVDLRGDYLWDLGRPQRVRREGNLDDESPVSLDALGEWLDPAPYQWRPPHDWEWLCIEDALERHAVARRLEGQGRWEVVQADTLSSVVDRLRSEKPLVVVVGQTQPQTDADALAVRAGGFGLLVVAPGFLPLRRAASVHDNYRWERLYMERSERAAFDLSGGEEHVFGVGLRRWMWQRPPQWRTAFLRWLERHLDRARKDTQYSAEGMGTWLADFDPQEEWFRTPSDLLALCLGFEDERKLPKRDDPQAGHRLVAVLDRQQPGLASDMLDALCLARWQQPAVAWDGGLALADWKGLVPPRPAVPNAEEWNAVVEGKTLAERKAAQQACLQRIRLADPQWLVDSGLVVPANGHHDFRHRAVAHLCLRDLLVADMVQPSTDRWAGACFDPPRRRLVDAALDTLSMEELATLSDRLVQPDADALQSLGAAEAVFCAVGRRFARRPAERDASRFAPLVWQMLERLDLDDADWTLPAPWSCPVDTAQQQLDWITVCWAWSLVPLPDVPKGQWLFPGWSGDAVLPAAPSWLTALWPKKGTAQLPPAWRLFFDVADAWVREVVHPLPDAPRLLHLAYLAEAGLGEWEAQVAWWENEDDLYDFGWWDNALVQRLERQDAATVVRRLWKSYVRAEAAPKHASFGRLPWLRRRIRRWLLESAPVSVLIDGLDEEEVRYLAHWPHTLPPALRGPLLLRFAAMAPGQWLDHAPEWWDRFGPAAAEALEQILRTENDLARYLGSTLWNWAPDRAARLLSERSDGLSQADLSSLVRGCPVVHRHLAVAALRAQPALLCAEERHAWARSVLPGSGALAAQLVLLFNAAQMLPAAL